MNVNIIVSPALAEVLTKFVKPDEGGYVERRSEAGGAGNFGIAFDTFAAWRHMNGYGHSTFQDLKEMTWIEAMQLYAHMYADVIHFDAVAPGSNYVLLDSCINNGDGGVAGFAREAVGLPIEDAKGRRLRFSPDVLWAIKNRIPKDFVNKFCDVRLKHQKGFKLYNQLPGPSSKHTYGYVWDKRVEKVRERALSMIEGAHR